MSSNWLHLRSVYIIFDLDSRCFCENCHVCMHAIGALCKFELLPLFHSAIFSSMLYACETQKFDRQFLKFELGLGLDHIRFLSPR